MGGTQVLMAKGNAFLSELRSILGERFCLDDSAACRVYGRDASGLRLGRPRAVVLPSSHDQVVSVVRLCAGEGVPFVARGAGTGLSGGALPPDDSVVISLARLDRIEGAEDPERGTVLVDPGVTNAALGRRLARRGGTFAPDPSSQEASTIGGNIAENAGGPHCLKVGMTHHHTRSLRWVDPQGRTWSSRAAGWDLTPLLVGSEGVLGVVTQAELVVTPLESTTVTLLAYVPALELAARAVVDLLAKGLLPGALEVVDGPMLAIVEEAFGFGFRTDAAAAMIVEFSGIDDQVGQQAEQAAAHLRALGAEVIPARDEQERLALWRCRKRAFGAVGRLSPDYVTMDVAVPLGRLPEMVRVVQEVAASEGVRIATALHAGDGNLHPGVMYDARDEASSCRAHVAADRIIDAALRLGGVVTGEHGVGIEKLEAMTRQVDPVTMTLLQGVKTALDPDRICNPGKAIPDAPGTADFPGIPQDIVVAVEDLMISAPAGTPLDSLREQAGRRGFGLAGDGDGPLVDVLEGDVDLRGDVTEVWARTGDGRRFHAGRPVVKNVTGLDLGRLICATGCRLATLEAVTLRLRPKGERPADVLRPGPAVASPEPSGPLDALRRVFDPDGLLKGGGER